MRIAARIEEYRFSMGIYISHLLPNKECGSERHKQVRSQEETTASSQREHSLVSPDCCALRAHYYSS